MRNWNKSIIFIILLFLLSCDVNRKNKLPEYRRILEFSDNPTELIVASYNVGELNDTFSIPLLLKKMADPRRTNSLYHKGMNVYYAKICALQKITGKKFGKIKSLTEPDSAIISLWNNWWMENKKTYIKE
ncbi:MAG: hypothetical protein HYV28_12420 [Ignavibacteriales bacterium]|nr:hypothetical protein [Ignavibacteriales bacterium]